MQFDTRVKPLTTIAWGECGTDQKLVRLGHSLWLETGDQSIHRYRVRVCHTVRDDGVERSLGHAPSVYEQSMSEELIAAVDLGELFIAHGLTRILVSSLL